MIRIFSYFFIAWISIHSVHAGEGVLQVEGRVLEEGSGKPLAFVHVVIQGRRSGTITNLDGYFSIESNRPFDSLSFSYTGYAPKKVSLSKHIPVGVEELRGLRVFMTPQAYQLSEFVMTPGENPALEIIQKTIDNREKYNPQSNKSYKYDSYNKFYISNTLALGEAEMPKADDSAGQAWYDYLANHHLFMMESIINHKYLRPGRVQEEVLAISASGFKRPYFIELGQAFQIMSFHEASVNIMGTRYKSPLADNALKNYFYEIQDTVIKLEDSTFIISFEPQKDHYNAFTGTLFINSKDFALENVIAEARIAGDDNVIKIQQQYKRTDEGNWFPYEVNTHGKVPIQMVMNSESNKNDSIKENVEVDTSKNEDEFKAEFFLISRSKVNKLELNIDMNRRDFTPFAFYVPESAYDRPDSFWLEYRDAPDSITINTYKLMDSIGEVHNFDRYLEGFGALINGYIPWRIFYIDMAEILRFNQYEGLRTGLSVRTNHRFSSNFIPAAYVAFGFKDEKLKYGGSFDVRFHRDTDSRLKLSYSHDVAEVGQTNYIQTGNRLLISNTVRDFIGNLAIDYTRYELLASSRLLRFTNLNAFFAVEDRSVRPEFLQTDINRDMVFKDYRVVEAGIKTRYAFGERLIRSGDFYHSSASKYPVFYLNYTTGFSNFLEGDLAFNRINFKATYERHFTSTGTTKLSLYSGFQDKLLPPSMLFTGSGANYKDFFIMVDNTFQSMQVNEFFSDRFITLNWQQELFSLHLHANSNPQFVLWNMAGWSSLSNSEQYQAFGIRAFPKGYYESGLKINRIYKQFGFGGFYRYGPYRFDAVEDNIFLKLVLSYRIEDFF